MALRIARGHGVIHRNHLRRFHQFNSLIAVAAPATTSQLRLNHPGLAYQNDSHSKIARRSERAVNLDVWRMVASHCVENDFARQAGFSLRLSSHELRLGLFDLHYCATFVMAALGTDAVGHAGFATVWTERGLRHTQGVVRAPFISTSF